MRQPATNAPTLLDLATALLEAKARETAARDRRLEIETTILAHPEVAPLLREEGTTSVGPVKVVTKLARKWSQPDLAAFAQEIDHAYFPFRVEWKEDAKMSKVVQERFPELWKKIRTALVLTPSKPTVSVREEVSA